ncbi:MAG: uracil phosphoribosyltransferase [Candidatus Fermentibacteraceae bacterium]
MEIIEFEHPVARDILTGLRDRTTNSADFRMQARRLALMLAVETTRYLPTEPVQVETPLEATLGERLVEQPVLVPIMRAGMGMLEAFQIFLPGAPVGFVALRRDEETAEPIWFYRSLPDVRDRRMLILDPMLATGGTAEEVLADLFDRGADSAWLVCAVAAPEGISRLGHFDDLTIVTVSVDRELDEDWFIRPGLGDFGDRLYDGEPGNGQG